LDPSEHSLRNAAKRSFNFVMDLQPEVLCKYSEAVRKNAQIRLVV
jgi:hypothetical protein